MENEYLSILKSGMFWVFFPEMIGEWEKDKQPFTEFYNQRELNKLLTYNEN